ncbi:ras-related protein rab-26 [Lynx pardinus]|uniref:small monomeric GTPase n=1 Tax=Lynx pardinus TaxID=191816 RepID=A0A485PRN0_LYNPA|nr:ras-related protein rab-26 [Lynx pardinus]
MPPPQRGHWRRRGEAGPEWLRAVGRGGGAAGSLAPAMPPPSPPPPPPPPRDGKKTPKRKGASGPAASALPAADGSRPARPGTARPGPQARPNGPPQPGRPSLGGGDFYDVAFKNKVLDVDGMKVKLQIWDTAGQERFRSVTHAYYRDAHALLLLYDVTNKASFDNIQAWLTEIQDYAQHDVVLMLLGNKVDSAQERVVKREDGEKLAKLFAGVRAALHGDQRQDRPQRRLGLHSRSKGVEAALHEGPQ